MSIPSLVKDHTFVVDSTTLGILALLVWSAALQSCKLLCSFMKETEANEGKDVCE